MRFVLPRSSRSDAAITGSGSPNAVPSYESATLSSVSVFSSADTISAFRSSSVQFAFPGASSALFAASSSRITVDSPGANVSGTVIYSPSAIK